MWQKENLRKSSFKDSVKTLESHIQHANNLAFALQQDYGGDSVYMKLHYGSFAPLLLYLIEWMDYSCTDSVISYLGLLQILVYQVFVDGVPTASSQNRIATLREFYAIIYPSLKQLEDDMTLLKEKKNDAQLAEDTILDEKRKLSGKDPTEDEECGICMEACNEAVLPNCGHSMCTTCFQNWNARSQSCPFCRGSLKKVSSGDLWFLMNKNDVLDMSTLAKENIRHFYLYIENLPLMAPDSHLLLYEYLI
ncbi:E3 ubiquitin-protein ligase AIRP2-like [Apium graveolens]|uniref:E3 ubiquitin-protein ligase AIRP2-like n=1 Tax=Apium graveolens TaxID=4045 RepID=UPI003D7ADA28